MFPTSIGRRLILLVLSLSIAVLGLEIYLTISSSSDLLASYVDDNFRSHHQAVSSALRNETEDIQTQTDDLTRVIMGRSAWTPSDLRTEMIERIGATPDNGIISASLYRTGTQQVFTIDYSDPMTASQGPLFRQTGVDSVTELGWVAPLLETPGSGWFGPTASLFSNATDPVVSFAMSYGPETNPTGVVWVDVSLKHLQTTMINMMAENETLELGYHLLVNEAGEPITITRLNTEGLDENVVTLTQAVAISSDLQEINDPFAQANSYAIRSSVRGTTWDLLTLAPISALPRSLPPQTLSRIILVSVFGLAFLAFVVQQFIQQSLAQPLEDLSSAAQEIGSGDMRYQIGYRKRHDEIGRLARALEDMKNNLSSSYRELEVWSSTLEQRVNNRTRQLDIARREAQANANELRALYDESLLVVSTYQLQTILQTLCQRILTMLEGSYCGVWLLTDDTENMRLVANTSSSDHALDTQIRTDEGLVGRAFTDDQLLVVDDYRNWSHRIPEEATSEMHQAMAVPLTFSGERIGVVIVGRTLDAAFFEVNDQRLLRLFANLVSPAVRNAQLLMQRDEAVEEAERANTVKTRFLASVTHELRTPLNIVINNLDFMRIGAFGEVTDEQAHRLDQTIRSAQHLLYLINDLLDVSKIEAGEMELFIQTSSLDTVLEDVIADTHAMVNTKSDQVAFHTQIAEQIPSFPMDVRRVRQILVNLLSNAVKFTEVGQVSLSVQARTDDILFSIQDTGIGVPEEEQSLLFEAFERTRQAKEKAIEGTGLGLPICKFLVESHGGEIWFTSEEGVGTTFYFTLPLTQPDPTSMAATQQMAALLNRERK